LFSTPALVDESWEASLSLGFADVDGETRLVRRGHRGPLVVQRPFYPEGGRVCHAYILHPPGGIVAGDRLSLDVEVGPGAHALLTAPAATKVYRSEGRTARQTQTIRAADDSLTEWLPQDTILFEGARARLETRIELSARAAFMGWDIVCLGRPACGERFATGTCRQHFELWREGEPLVLERTLYEGSMQDAPWGLRGASVSALLVATSPVLTDASTAGLLQDLRKLRSEGALLSASEVGGGVLVFRLLGNGAEPARILLEQAWSILRPTIVGRPACHPRIWST
jgi:urease accessory protein